MGSALLQPWTVEQFLDWAAAQEGRYEFDGLQPVAMTSGSANHSRIIFNIQTALTGRLRGGPCSTFSDVGVRTVGNAVRYPDVLITCTKFPGTDRIAPNVAAVFEILSPDSGRRDRIEKVQEYAGVSSICFYVILESTSIGLTVLHRRQGGDPWTALTLTNEGTLLMPGLGIEVPVAAFYEDTDLAA